MNIELPIIDENIGAVELRVVVVAKDTWARDGKVYKTDESERELYFCYTNGDRREQIEMELAGYLTDKASAVDTVVAATTYLQTMERKGDAWVTLDTPIKHDTKKQTLRHTHNVDLGDITISKHIRVPVFFQKAFKRLPTGIDGCHAVRAGRYHYRRLQRHLGLSYYLGTRICGAHVEHTLARPVQMDGHIVLNPTFVREV